MWAPCQRKYKIPTARSARGARTSGKTGTLRPSPSVATHVSDRVSTAPAADRPPPISQIRARIEREQRIMRRRHMNRTIAEKLQAPREQNSDSKRRRALGNEMPEAES